MNLSLALVGSLAFYLLAGLAQVYHWRYPQRQALRLIAPLMGVALFGHGFVLALGIPAEAGINLALPIVATLFTFALAVLVWLLCLLRPFHHLLMLVFPVTLITLLMLALFTSKAPPTTVHLLSQNGLWLHIPLALSAYSFITLSFFQAILLLVQEGDLRSPKPLQLGQLLPPLVVMERQLFQLLRIGVALLTLAILSGFLFLEDMFSQRLAYHTLLSLLSWLVLAGLLLGHHSFGWRGRGASKWMIAGFVPLLLAYFGSKFVLEVLLSVNGS